MRIERIKINTVFKNISFILLCAYLAFSYLSYIPGVPKSIVTLMLYGFVAVSVCTMIFSRKVKLNAHVKWYGVFIIACFFSALYSVVKNLGVSVLLFKHSRHKSENESCFRGFEFICRNTLSLPCQN